MLSGMPTPSPSSPPWIEIQGPLFVVAPGGWQVLISVLALVISGGTLWFTLTARARVVAQAERIWLQFEHGPHPDGDYVTIFNIGRTGAIILDIRALTKTGNYLKAEQMPKGFDSKAVQFPELPHTLPPHGALQAWFSTGLTKDSEAGHDHGYQIRYMQPSGFTRKMKPKTLIVRAPRPPEPDSLDSVAAENR